jgi:hypothetical protein
MDIDEADLLRRAMGAWFRTGGTEQPANTSRVTERKGLVYVILDNVTGPLAVYRLRNDGMLKRLRRWPHEVTAGLGATG